VLNGLGLRNKHRVKVYVAGLYLPPRRAGALKEGDQMVFTYVPGTGTTLAIKGNDKITIADPAFGRMLFSVWLGPKPTQCGPEKRILGQ